MCRPCPGALVLSGLSQLTLMLPLILLPVCPGAPLNSPFLEEFLPQPCQTWHFCLCFQVVWSWQEADKLRPSKFSKLEESYVL